VFVGVVGVVDAVEVVGVVDVVDVVCGVWCVRRGKDKISGAEAASHQGPA